MKKEFIRILRSFYHWFDTSYHLISPDMREHLNDEKKREVILKFLFSDEPQTEEEKKIIELERL